MREYLDPIVKAAECAQYLDNIGFAAKTTTDLDWNLLAGFNCIRRAEVKLTMERCHFGVRQVEIPGGTIPLEGTSPQARIARNSLDKLRFTKSKKTLNLYLGFENYYINFFPRMAKKT